MRIAATAAVIGTITACSSPLPCPHGETHGRCLASPDAGVPTQPDAGTPSDSGRAVFRLGRPAVVRDGSIDSGEASDSMAESSDDAAAETAVASDAAPPCDSGCGEAPCVVRTGQCSRFDGTERRPCEPCDTDENCTAPLRCVPTYHQGLSRGGACLRPADMTGCAAPYAPSIGSRTTLSGTEAANYCVVDEAVTTCEAILAFYRHCTREEDCGEGGSCVQGRCTIGCARPSGCPEAFSCSDGVCSSPHPSP